MESVKRLATVAVGINAIDTVAGTTVSAQQAKQRIPLQVTTGQQAQTSGQKTVTLSSPQQATILQPAQAHSGQQFIVTISGDGNGENMQEVQIQQGTPSQVIYQAGHNSQYVDEHIETSNHHHQQPRHLHSSPVYYPASSTGQIQNYSEYNQVYNPVSGNFYHSAGSGQMTQLGGLQSQVLQGGTYLVQSTMDGDGQHITHTTRASPATDNNQQRSSHFDVKSWQREAYFIDVKNVGREIEVQWLIDNYETAEGVSLPRSTLYNHYLRHCQEQKIDPMNPASFGKLIRSVFLGLRTRRLGTRGNSKYHYYGIRIKMESALNSMMDDYTTPMRSTPTVFRRGNSKYHYYGIRIKPTSPLNAFTDDHALPMRQQPMNPGKRFKPAGGGAAAEGSEGGSGGPGSVSSGENSQQHQHQQFLGDASSAIPVFGHVEAKSTDLPEGISLEHVRYFEELFKKHCEQILNIVVNLHFSEVEKIWQAFWRTTPVDQKQNAETIAEHKLPKEKLYALSHMPVVKEFVRRSDYAFYQALVEVLIPDVLRPIPSSLTQAVRNFAKSLESWLKNAMSGVPEDMVKTKIASVSAFAQTLRRYTSLNHLAQAARAVLQNNTQISQMLTDLNRVDFTNVQEQASWVCECEDGLVHQIQEDFKSTLQGQNSLETWALWLEGVVNRVLSPHEGGPNFAKAARQFLLKWSFYSSMVIRDLTLRSAASFGSFHLIRLLYDEYMFYLVEHKVAAATDESPIAVMGEVRHQSLESTIPSTTLDMDNKVQLANALTGRSHATLTTVGNHGNLLTTQQLVAAAGGGTQHLAVSTPSGLAQVANLGAHSSTGHPTTVAVVASGAGGSGTKTIVVVPVSATSGSGDGPTIKRIKTA